jgi:hypothetical protein
MCFDGTTPVGTVPAEGTITIKFCRDSATSPATITIDDGEGDVRTVEIPLDENHCGTITWQVPAGWSVVNLNYPGCVEWSLIVTPA